MSCCNALADLLRINVRLNLAKCAPELLKKLFRVMDDIHEGTRLAATNTIKALSRVSFVLKQFVYCMHNIRTIFVCTVILFTSYINSLI